MSSDDLGPESSGARGARPGYINDQMLHIQVLVPIEVEYAMNFRDELDKYLKLFPDIANNKVREHFRSNAKPVGLNDDVITNILDKRLAERDAGLKSRSLQEERDVKESITGAGTDPFVGFYTAAMIKRLAEINTELGSLKSELEPADEEYDDFGPSAEEVASIQDRIVKLEKARQEIYSKSNKLGRELTLQDKDKFDAFINKQVKPSLAKLSSQTGMLFSKVHQKTTGKQAVVAWTDDSLKPTQRPGSKLQS